MSEDKLPRNIIQGEKEIALDELKVETLETPSDWLLRAVQGFLSLYSKFSNIFCSNC